MTTSRRTFPDAGMNAPNESNHVSRLKLVLVLTENWTMLPGTDLRGLVRMAREAEDSGFDAVMLSEHVVLGPDAGAAGLMDNPRDWAYPGNQDPATPWPNSLILLGAIAAVTSTLRLVAGAVIAPLRHPLLLAKELATLDQLSQGRLVVIPTVSWSRDEYAALGVPIRRAGRSSGRASGGMGSRSMPARLPASTACTTAFATSIWNLRRTGRAGRGYGSAASGCIPPFSAG